MFSFLRGISGHKGNGDRAAQSGSQRRTNSQIRLERPREFHACDGKLRYTTDVRRQRYRSRDRLRELPKSEIDRFRRSEIIRGNDGADGYSHGSLAALRGIGEDDTVSEVTFRKDSPDRDRHINGHSRADRQRKGGHHSQTRSLLEGGASDDHILG